MSDFMEGGLPGWLGWRPENADRLYPLTTRGNPAGEADFYTGTTPDNLQRVMGPWGSRLIVCLSFNTDGSPVRLETQKVREPLPGEFDASSDWDHDFGWCLRQALVWQKELSWQPGLIRVRRFMVAENPICISDYPRWAIRYLADPIYCYRPDAREEIGRNVREWEDGGSFVFRWGKDFYISRDGLVLAT